MTPDAKNVAASVMTLNNDGLTQMTAGFNSIYQLTTLNGPNGVTSSFGYDAHARPKTTTSAIGAVTTFEYFDSQRMKKTSIGSGSWVKTYFDGFGRTIREVSGYGTDVVVSSVDTEYDSCGCSPLGKVWRVSRPYGPGQTATLWTVYTYDSLGRVVSVAQPAGAGSTTYEYTGNVTKVTSPGGNTKWKQHEVDALGNLVKVTEPNPAGGANLETTYTYNDRNLLLTVTMGSQTRTFTVMGHFVCPGRRRNWS